jgi:hypothetical protein
VDVDTDQFAAITGRVEQLAADLAALDAEFTASIPLVTTAYHSGFNAGVAAGVESVLGRPAGPRPRHLRPVDGGGAS